MLSTRTYGIMVYASRGYLNLTEMPVQTEAQENANEDCVHRRPAETQEEIGTLHRERDKLRSKLRKAEQELEELKAANITVREEREQLRKKIRSLQDALERRKSASQSPIPCPSPTPSAGSNRTNSLPRQPHMQSAESRRTSIQTQPSVHNSSSSPFTPVQSMKFSGSPASTLQRQKNNAGPSSDLGSSVGDDIKSTDFTDTLTRCLRTRIPETLLNSLITYRRLDQVLESLHGHYSAEILEKTRELELQVEHLSSKLSHLKSQNDLLQLCLEESKGNCERLSLLVAKYESKDTALVLALQNTDQIVEAYEVMLQLQESEQDLLVASYRSNMQSFATDTIKSLTSTNSSKSNVSGASSLTSNSHYQLTYGDDLPDDDEGIAMFQTSQTKRRDAESHAKNLLQKLDRKYEAAITGSPFLNFDENFDFNSRTSTLSSANSSNFETLSKEEELRLKEYVQLLKTERSTVETTVVELESVTDVLEIVDDSNIETGDKGSLDLETAVLLQELQALKEERAELKHRIFMLDKERKALELKLNSREAQEQGYIAHIEYLKSEVKEQMKKRKQILKEERKLRGSTQDDDGHSSASGNAAIGLPVSEFRASEEDIPQDLHEAARREKKLKSRIQELVDTLEKLSKNSEIRHQQTAEYISDLKRANGALVSAYEKAKKRHASRLKKFEAQLITMAEKHQEQTRVLKERISKLTGDDDKSKPRRQKESSL
ncbi:colorectal mutant cancer protein-like isoform X2 [Rhopilema esculentum]|uniref:colorectal mutant cancer protein-like isoform X2 n=1 Tax=Rhopilema esculentum TaxID=499914 RepID=UPI0031D11976